MQMKTAAKYSEWWVQRWHCSFISFNRLFISSWKEEERQKTKLFATFFSFKSPGVSMIEILSLRMATEK